MTKNDTLLNLKKKNANTKVNASTFCDYCIQFSTNFVCCYENNETRKHTYSFMYYDVIKCTENNQYHLFLPIFCKNLKCMNI